MNYLDAKVFTMGAKRIIASAKNSLKDLEDIKSQFLI